MKRRRQPHEAKIGPQTATQTASQITIQLEDVVPEVVVQFLSPFLSNQDVSRFHSTCKNWRSALLTTIISRAGYMRKSDITTWQSTAPGLKNGDTRTLASLVHRVVITTQAESDFIGEFMSTVTHLLIEGTFDSPLDFLPPSLLVLSVTSLCFNQDIQLGMLPPGLLVLNLQETSLNHPLHAGTFPASLQCIIFSDHFMRPVQPGVLPEFIQHIKFGRRFNQPLAEGVLPKSVIYLEFGHLFRCSLTRNILPPGPMRSLLMPNCYKNRIEPGDLPVVETLQVSCDSLAPDSLTGVRYLRLRCDKLRPGDIPHTVTELEITTNNTLTLSMIPKRIEKLKLGHNTRIHIPPQSRFPSTLTELDLGIDFRYKLFPGIFPSTLRLLSLGCYFNHPVELGVLPASLHSLNLGPAFNHPIDRKAIPQSLRLVFVSASYRYCFPAHVTLKKPTNMIKYYEVDDQSVTTIFDPHTRQFSFQSL